MLSGMVSGMASERDAAAAEPPGPAVPRRVLGWEVCVVLALSLGQSGVYALVSLLADLTAPKALAHQQAVLNGSAAPGRPWLDLTYQLLGILAAVIPALLAVFLLERGGHPPSAIGLDGREPRRDLVRGILLALLI